MSLPQHEQRLLRRIDRTLSRSDPDLAYVLSVLARLNTGEKMAGAPPRASAAGRCMHRS